MDNFKVENKLMDELFDKYECLYGSEKMKAYSKTELSASVYGCAGCGGSCVSGCAERGGCGPHGPR